MRVDEDMEIIGFKAICAIEGGLKTDDPNGFIKV